MPEPVTPIDNSNIAEQVSQDVSEWKSKDLQSRTAEEVNKTLEGLELPVPGGDGSDPEKPSGVNPGAGKGQTDPEYEEEKSRLAQVFKKRDQVLKEREAARAESETIMSEARRVQAEAQQLMYQAQQAAQWVQLLRTNPAQAIKAAGLDPEEFILNLAEEDNPERKRDREYKEKLQEFEDWKKAQEEREKQYLEHIKAQQFEEHKKTILNKFYTLSKDETKSPNVKKALDDGFVTEKALEEYGHDISNQVFKLTGQYPAIEEIVEYIDNQYSKAYKKFQTATPSSVAPKPQPSVKPAVKPISLDDASDRRALDGGVKDLVGDERTMAAREAVRAVFKKLGK